MAVLTDGRVYPPVEGLVLTEYAADGSELQRSSTTQVDGTFQFARRLNGTRVEALYSSATSRVLPVYSARIANKNPGSSLEVNPLTTWFDQQVVNGVSAEEASNRIRGIVVNNCPVQSDLSSSKYFYAGPSLLEADHDWLLSAVAAYLQAARNVGIGPKIDFAGWTKILDKHGLLIAQFCEYSASVSSQTWAQAQSDRLKAEAAQNSVDGARLTAAVTAARSQGLSLMSRQILLHEYPDQTRLLQPQNLIFSKPILELGSDFVLAHYLDALSQGNIVKTKTEVSGGASAGLAFSSGGEIVRSVAGTAAAVNDLPAKLRLTNRSFTDKQVKLALNGQRMGDLPAIVEEIVALPMAFADEPLYRKAWRYVIEHRRRTTPVAGGNFQHQPDLWLRSIGSSFCDAQAAVLQWIWVAMGYEARVVGLTGHVTVEIKVDGRWLVFDPYLETYYTDQKGQVVGIAELVADASLVTNPVTPLLPLSDVAYSQLIADIFSSRQDNFTYTTHMVPIAAPMSNIFQIPAGGYAEFSAAHDQMQRTTVLNSPDVNMSSVRLWVPPGYSGIVKLPLLAVNVTGMGSIRMLGKEFDVSKVNVRDVLDEYYQLEYPDVGINEVEIIFSGASGLTITLLLNPIYFKKTDELGVRAYGKDLAGLSFGTTNE